jgi:hypothetical protein
VRVAAPPRIRPLLGKAQPYRSRELRHGLPAAAAQLIRSATFRPIGRFQCLLQSGDRHAVPSHFVRLFVRSFRLFQPVFELQAQTVERVNSAEIRAPFERTLKQRVRLGKLAELRIGQCSFYQKPFVGRE